MMTEIVKKNAALSSDFNVASNDLNKCFSKQLGNLSLKFFTSSFQVIICLLLTIAHLSSFVEPKLAQKMPTKTGTTALLQTSNVQQPTQVINKVPIAIDDDYQFIKNGLPFDYHQGSQGDGKGKVLAGSLLGTNKGSAGAKVIVKKGQANNQVGVDIIDKSYPSSAIKHGESEKYLDLLESKARDEMNALKRELSSDLFVDDDITKKRQELYKQTSLELLAGSQDIDAEMKHQQRKQKQQLVSSFGTDNNQLHTLNNRPNNVTQNSIFGSSNALTNVNTFDESAQASIETKLFDVPAKGSEVAKLTKLITTTNKTGKVPTLLSKQQKPTLTVNTNSSSKVLAKYRVLIPIYLPNFKRLKSNVGLQTTKRPPIKFVSETTIKYVEYEKLEPREETIIKTEPIRQVVTSEIIHGTPPPLSKAVTIKLTSR